MFRFPAAILCALFIAAVPAHAEIRIATIDVNRVLNASSEAKAARASLDEASAKAKKIIDEKKEALRPLEEKAKSGKLDPSSKEAAQLKKQTRDLVTLVREKEDELRKEFMNSNKALTKKTMNIVEEYAKEHDLQVVFDKSSGVRNAVLYGDDSFDITDEIVKRINR